MTQSPMTLARLLAIAWCTAYPLATAACARHHAVAQSAPEPAPEARVPVTLRVTNSNWSDVRIYVVRGAMWVRLGLVTTNSTVEFSIPADFLTQAGNVTLVANPVAGSGSWTTPLPDITPGDEFELVIENYLQYSHLVVR
jgi:hypothetical protein